MAKVRALGKLLPTLFGHLNPSSQFAVDRESASVAVLGRSRIEHDPRRLHLRPCDSPELSQTCAGVVAEHEKELEVIRKRVAKFPVLVVFKETGSDIAFNKPRDVG